MVVDSGMGRRAISVTGEDAIAELEMVIETHRRVNVYVLQSSSILQENCWYYDFKLRLLLCLLTCSICHL